MEETNQTEEIKEATKETVTTETKSQHVIAGVALLLVLLVILFIVLKPAEQATAPVTDEDATENQDDASATTTTSTTTTGGTTETTNDKGEQVINGLGYTATIRPVEKVTPIITEFTARASASGSTCFYTWNVDLAQRCSLMTGPGTGIKNIGTEGSIQIKPGTYTLECDGAGRGKAKSEPLTCGV